MFICFYGTRTSNKEDIAVNSIYLAVALAAPSSHLLRCLFSHKEAAKVSPPLDCTGEADTHILTVGVDTAAAVDSLHTVTHGNQSRVTAIGLLSCQWAPHQLHRRLKKNNAGCDTSWTNAAMWLPVWTRMRKTETLPTLVAVCPPDLILCVQQWSGFRWVNHNPITVQGRLRKVRRYHPLLLI